MMDDEEVLALGDDDLRQRVKAFMAWADENVHGTPGFRATAEDDADWSEKNAGGAFNRRDFMDGFEFALRNARDFLNGRLS